MQHCAIPQLLPKKEIIWMVESFLTHNASWNYGEWKTFSHMISTIQSFCVLVLLQYHSALSGCVRSSCWCLKRKGWKFLCTIWQRRFWKHNPLLVSVMLLLLFRLISGPPIIEKTQCTIWIIKRQKTLKNEDNLPQNSIRDKTKDAY